MNLGITRQVVFSSARRLTHQRRYLSIQTSTTSSKNSKNSKLIGAQAELISAKIKLNDHETVVGRHASLTTPDQFKPNGVSPFSDTPLHEASYLRGAPGFLIPVNVKDGYLIITKNHLGETPFVSKNGHPSPSEGTPDFIKSPLSESVNERPGSAAHLDHKTSDAIWHSRPKISPFEEHVQTTKDTVYSEFSPHKSKLLQCTYKLFSKS